MIWRKIKITEVRPQEVVEMLDKVWICKNRTFSVEY